MKIFYYDIAINLPLRQCFTYKSNIDIKNGMRVVVPFGKKNIIGIVIKKQINLNIDKDLKEIKSVVDEYTCFDKSIFKTILWASDYYHHPIGEVFFSFIPTMLRKNNNKTISKSDTNIEYKINKDDKNLKLTPEQKNNLQNLNKIKSFSPSLIYGVTGSGKTEIYLQLAEKFLKKNKSVLILVPEINLIPQLVNRFKNRFLGEIGVYHSRKTSNKRLDIWLKSKFGKLKIVIGKEFSFSFSIKII